MATSSHTGSWHSRASARSWRTRIFAVAVVGRAPADAYEPGDPLRPEVRLPGKEPAKPVPVELGARSQLNGRHHLVADHGVWDCVHGSHDDVGMALQNPDDRGSREVLSVDP